MNLKNTADPGYVLFSTFDDFKDKNYDLLDCYWRSIEDLKYLWTLITGMNSVALLLIGLRSMSFSYHVPVLAH